MFGGPCGVCVRHILVLSDIRNPHPFVSSVFLSFFCCRPHTRTRVSENARLVVYQFGAQFRVLLAPLANGFGSSQTRARLDLRKPIHQYLRLFPCGMAMECISQCVVDKSSCFQYPWVTNQTFSIVVVWSCRLHKLQHVHDTRRAQVRSSQKDGISQQRAVSAAFRVRLLVSIELRFAGKFTRRTLTHAHTNTRTHTRSH